MICQRCLLRLGSWRAPLPRFVSTSRSLNAERIQAARGPPSGSHEGPPAATSTSKAQPFSASMTPAEPPQQPTTLTPARVVSSVKAGTVFKGLGFYKNKDPPVAMEDHEYPDWLWTLLDKGEKSISGTAGSENDLYAKSRRMRRLARKAERKATRAAELDPSAHVAQVPIEHQTIDLPAGDGSLEGSIEAVHARDELNLAMRRARRRSIKEANFLKGMR